MKEHEHFTKFRDAHRMSLKVARAHNTAPNGTSTAGAMQGIRHLPDQLPFWMRARMHLTKGWDVVTVNKQVDSITMPKWIASAILLTVLGFGVTSWWRSSDQRDMLIELKTELRIAKEHEAEKQKELKEQAELNKVYIDNMTNQLNVIKGMLSAQQLNAVESTRRSN